MLWESLQYLSTPCEPWAKELGYLYESIATSAKYQRCKKEWEPHLQRTRQCILSASNQIAPSARILIFGSGWLLDIPLDELAGKFREIVLVDVVHPKESVEQAKKFPNVRLLHLDVTDWMHSFLNAKSMEEIPAPPATPKVLLQEAPFEFVVSVNILSQLCVKPFVWLEKKFTIDSPQLDTWERRAQRAHLNLMETLARARCLITDTDYRTMDGNDIIIERDRLLSDIHLPESVDSWDWHITPKHESGDGTYTLHSVQCSLW